jgi:hypothetical protein
MLMSALVLWIVVLSLFKLGSVVGAVESGPGGADGRAPACFPHDKHMEIVESCTVCHHRFEDGVNVLQEDELDGSDAMRCHTCHNEEASLDARQAFHRQCIQCHRQNAKQDAMSGPRTCGGCHPRSFAGDIDLLMINRTAGA